MSVDDLAEKISVVYFETTRNERGDIVKGAEITRCTVWAKVLPLAGRINNTPPEILPDDLIIWRGKRLKIRQRLLTLNQAYLVTP